MECIFFYPLKIKINTFEGHPQLEKKLDKSLLLQRKCMEINDALLFDQLT